MTITKKVLSLVLVLAMLLTMASFPAFAAYTPKTVEFVRTGADANMLAHNSNVAFTLANTELYVGDTITFPATFFTDNAITYGDGVNVAGVGLSVQKTGTSATENLQGGTVQWPSASKASYTFTEAGTYLIRSAGIYNGSTTAWKSDRFFCAVEVKEYTGETTKPTTDKTSGDAIALTSAEIRYLDKGSSGTAALKTAPILGSSSHTIATACPAGTVVDWQFAVNTEAYVETITWKATDDNLYSTVDVYGSLNGTDWYLLADDSAVVVTGDDTKTFTVAVGGVAKFLMFKNFGYKGTSYSQNITGAAVTGFSVEQNSAPTPIDITFVDKTVNSTNADKVVTINSGEKVTAPAEYATDYKFYSNADCTVEIDLATETFIIAATVYVKSTKFNFPTYESNDVPKAVLLVPGPGDVAVLPAGVTVNVGDTLVFPVGHDYGVHGKDVGSWSALNVKRLSSEDGSVDPLYYSNNKGNLLSKGSGQYAGIFPITEAGVYTVMNGTVAISEEITVNTFAKGTYVTSAPSADEAYAAKVIELVYDDVIEMYKLPAGTVVRVGDTLKFSNSLKIRDWDVTPNAIGSIQTLVSYDVNGNGKIDQDEVAAIDSKGSDDADVSLSRGEIKITNTGVYAFTTVGGHRTSTWLAPITVNEYAVDPSLIEGSNEIVYEDSSSFSNATGVDATEFVLTLKAKVEVGTTPSFTYSATPTNETVVKVDEECTAEYDVYLVTATFDFPDDEIEVTVTYGDNFRITANDTFYRYKSESVFGSAAELLEGDNAFIVSNLTPTFNPTASSQPSVLFTIQVQQFVKGVNAGVINGVEYKDLAINLVDVVSKSSRFENFTVERFLYNADDGVYRALLALTRGGIDQFVATLELTGVNVVTGQYEVIEEKTIKTDYIQTKLSTGDKDNVHRFGGNDVVGLLAQLKEIYADKNYVIIDTRTEYLVDEKGNFILDEQGNQIKNLAYKSNPGDCPNYCVDDVLWNGLINMNKSYFEFKYYCPTNDNFLGRNNIIKELPCVEVSYRFDKANHNMMRLDENGFFRIGFRFGSIDDNKNVKNAIKEQLGNAYDPLFFKTSWWTTNLPFTQTTLTLTLPEEWTAVNGYEDYKLYRYTVLGSSNMAKLNQLTLKQEGLAVKDRFDNELEIILTSGNIYDRHVLIGADGTVERPGDTTGKHNVATGGADLVATFATFAGIALAAYALRKREN